MLPVLRYIWTHSDTGKVRTKDSWRLQIGLNVSKYDIFSSSDSLFWRYDGSTDTVKVFFPFRIRIQSRMLLEVSQRPTVFFGSMVFGTYTKSIDKQEMHGLQILHIQKFNVNWKGKGKYFYNFTTFIIEIARHAMFLQGGR